MSDFLSDQVASASKSMVSDQAEYAALVAELQQYGAQTQKQIVDEGQKFQAKLKQETSVLLKAQQLVREAEQIYDVTSKLWRW